MAIRRVLARLLTTKRRTATDWRYPIEQLLPLARLMNLLHRRPFAPVEEHESTASIPYFATESCHLKLRRCDWDDDTEQSQWTQPWWRTTESIIISTCYEEAREAIVYLVSCASGNGFIRARPGRCAKAVAPNLLRPNLILKTWMHSASFQPGREAVNRELYGLVFQLTHI
jgi:hypothetical protein